MSLRLEWQETAPGLLYEVSGDSGRRYIIAAGGDNVPATSKKRPSENSPGAVFTPLLHLEL